jgi:hypothetical protein
MHPTARGIMYLIAIIIAVFFHATETQASGSSSALRRFDPAAPISLAQSAQAAIIC